ncbi:MAG: transcriptional repressor LexA [SAR86 cluster bacterium]|jgi:repressor LexA|nr:MAG: transcriptional repressor LexA [SAR86 cluster bacterium]|tara:strand:- start:6107 stop:6700 length:594 start_codon:yes stop_codon:yes gene_type:complete
MINLTEQQFKIFDVIKGHVNDYGYPPTRAEIAKIMGFKSVNAAESHIKALVKKGVLLKVPDSSRGLKLVEEYSGIPIVGRVAAGSPISAVENIEKYVPTNPISSPVDFFLRVKGDSMKDIGIIENDLVGVKKASTAENGSVVVARLEDEVTLKRFVQENGKIKLVAENKNYDDILIDQNSGFSLEGIAVGVVREDVF